MTVTVIECKKLSFNWRPVQYHPYFECNIFEVGKDGVARIDEMGDGSFQVHFEDGGIEQIYNPNRAKWEPVKK